MGKKNKAKQNKKKQPKTATESAAIRAAKHCVSEREQHDGLQSCKRTHACMHTLTPAHKSSPRNTDTQRAAREKRQMMIYSASRQRATAAECLSSYRHQAAPSLVQKIKKPCRLLCNRASVHLIWSHWKISSEWKCRFLADFMLTESAVVFPAKPL